jgi:hypothetical protein
MDGAAGATWDGEYVMSGNLWSASLESARAGTTRRRLIKRTSNATATIPLATMRMRSSWMRSLWERARIESRVPGAGGPPVTRTTPIVAKDAAAALTIRVRFQICIDFS